NALITSPSVRASTSAPAREVEQRVRTASSASDSSIESTAPSRRTTPATDPAPTGSSNCRSIRQASACDHVTEASVSLLTQAASHSFRTNDVLLDVAAAGHPSTRVGQVMTAPRLRLVVPLPYLAHLRREQLPYLLVAGADRVDLEFALTKIHSQLGAECLLSEAGGGLHGALLGAGLVDELHVITIPALVGGL